MIELINPTEERVMNKKQAEQKDLSSWGEGKKPPRWKQTEEYGEILKILKGKFFWVNMSR